MVEHSPQVLANEEQATTEDPKEKWHRKEHTIIIIIFTIIK